MTEVSVLIEGYAKEKDGNVFASSTTTLIQESGLNIVVDPGMNRKLLLDALDNDGLSISDIDYVILTHYHLDHSLLAGIFENAKILDNGEVYSWDGKIESHGGKIPKTNIKIIKTPGHDMFHCSVIVDTDNGKIAIVGDVLWWRDDQEQKTDKDSLMKHEDHYVKNKDQLMESRKQILEIADYIIPGHGKMFKVTK
jgi:glyoxylase-like metal-dependent hydrolase (beta-lactamase superfamily II)